MARKLAKKAVVGKKAPAAKKPRAKKGKATRVYSVTMHRRPPEYVRSIVVIDTDDPLWIDVDDNDADLVHAYPDAKDGIVWVIPPHDASEQAIERMVRAVKNDGAHTIKLMSRATSAAVVPAQRHQDAEDGEPKARQTSRELVMEMADEANSTDVKALKALLNDVLGEEGL